MRTRLDSIFKLLAAVAVGTFAIVYLAPVAVSQFVPRATMQIIEDADCASEACTQESLYCTDTGGPEQDLLFKCNPTTGFFVLVHTGGGGGGLTHTVNGLVLASTTAIDFDDGVAGAPAGGVNVVWFKDALSPTNVGAAPDPTGAYDWTGLHQWVRASTSQAIRLKGTTAAQGSPEIVFDVTDNDTSSVRLRTNSAGSFSMLNDGAVVVMSVSANASAGSRHMTVLDGNLTIGDNTDVTRTLRFDRLAGDGLIAYDGTDFSFNDEIDVSAAGFSSFTRTGLAAGNRNILVINGDYTAPATGDEPVFAIRAETSDNALFTAMQIFPTVTNVTPGSGASNVQINGATTGSPYRGLLLGPGTATIGRDVNENVSLIFDRNAADGTLTYDGTDFGFSDNIDVGTFSILSTGAAISLQPATGFGVNLLGDGIHLISRDGLTIAATILRIDGDFGTGAALDDARIELRLTDDAGAQYIGGRIAWTTDVATAGAEDSRMSFNVASGGASARVLILGAPSNPASMTLGRNVDENIAFVFDALVGNASLTYQTVGPSFSLSHKLDVVEIERTGSFTIDVNGGGNSMFVDLAAAAGSEAFQVRDSAAGVIVNAQSSGVTLIRDPSAPSGIVSPLHVINDQAGAAAIGDGVQILMRMQNSAAAEFTAGAILFRATDVIAPEVTDFEIAIQDGSGGTAQVLFLDGDLGGDMRFGRNVDEDRTLTFNRSGTDGTLKFLAAGDRFVLSNKLDLPEIEHLGSFTVDVNGSGNDMFVDLFSQDGTESFIVRDSAGGFLLNIQSNGLSVMTAANAAPGTVVPLKLQVTRSGVGADGDTTRVEFTTEDDLGAAQIFGTVNVRATDVTSTTKDSDFRVTLLTDNVSSEQMRLTGATGGNLQFGRPTDEARSITFNQAGTDGIITHTVGGGFVFGGGDISQSSLVQIKADSIVGNATGSLADRAAIDNGDINSASPAGADFVIGFDASTGALEKYTVTDVGSGGGSGDSVLINGTDVVQPLGVNLIQSDGVIITHATGPDPETATFTVDEAFAYQWTNAHRFSGASGGVVVTLKGTTAALGSPELFYDVTDNDTTSVRIRTTSSGVYQIRNDSGTAALQLLVNAGSGLKDLTVDDGDIVLSFGGATVDGRDLDNVAMQDQANAFASAGTQSFDDPIQLESGLGLFLEDADGTNTVSFTTQNRTTNIVLSWNVATIGECIALGDGGKLTIDASGFIICQIDANTGGGGNSFGTIGVATADIASDTMTITDSLSINLIDSNDPEDLEARFFYNATLAGDHGMNAGECVFTGDGVGGGLICEGDAVDAFEALLLMNPTVNDQTISVPDVQPATADTVMLLGLAQTVTGEKTFGAGDLNVAAGNWSNAAHDHSTNNGGTILAASVGNGLTDAQVLNTLTVDLNAASLFPRTDVATNVRGEMRVPTATDGLRYFDSAEREVVSIGGQLGGTGTVPDVRGLRTTTGPTLLTMGAVVDGECLQRSGTAIVSAACSGGAASSVQVSDTTLTTRGEVRIPTATEGFIWFTGAEHTAVSLDLAQTITGGKTFNSDSLIVTAGNWTNAAHTHTTDNGGTLAAGVFTAQSIDGDDVAINIAGRSLTMDTAATPDEIDADAELFTDTKCFVVFDPAAGGENIASIYRDPTLAITITDIWCETDANTTTLNLQRDDGTPVDICTADIVCDVTGDGQSCGTIAAAEDNVASTERIDLDIVSSGTVARLSICFQFTKDD